MPEATNTLPLDPADFSRRFSQAALAAGFKEERFGEINGHPLHAYTKQADESQPRIYLSTGIHGDDPVRLYGELCEVLRDVVTHFEAEGRPLPKPTIRPMRDLV